MNFNRTQQFLLARFDYDLDENKFIDLKFIINKFFKNDNNLIANSEAFFQFKKSFLQLSKDILSIYSHIIYSFPNNPNSFLWKQKQEFWHNYILFFDEKSMCNNLNFKAELDNLLNEFKSTVELQNSLFESVKTNYNE